MKGTHFPAHLRSVVVKGVGRESVMRLISVILYKGFNAALLALEGIFLWGSKEIFQMGQIAVLWVQFLMQ